MERTLGLIVLAGVILAISLVFLGPTSSGPETPQSPARATQDRTFAWRFVTKEAEGELPPRTQVALITNGEVYDLGEYAGSCAELSNDQRLSGEVAGVLCWWAGVGDELGVFLEKGSYVVKHGVQEEPTAESEGSRGNFEQMVVLK